MATHSTAGDLRSQEVRELLARSEHDQVELAALGGLDLCVLGAPKHALCEEDLANAWLGLPRRRRRKITEVATESLLKRGHLIADGGTKSADIDTYALDPALGLVVAARSRPAFIVVTAIGATRTRTPRMYGVGDEDKPVRAVVVEQPAAMPLPREEVPHVAKMGPFGRLYRYILVSPDTATDWLASWLFQSVPEPLRTADAPLPARLVSVYHQGKGRKSPGTTVAFRNGEGRVQLLKDGAADGDVVGEYDQDQVRALMRDLLTPDGR